jgi:quinone-modifying oxidoreductase subunit QmoA
VLPILVIGGGISGVTSAVELAEAGKEVILVEKSSYLGGNVVKMHNYFPKLCPPACGMEINFRRIKNNPRIQVYTHTEVSDIQGDKGNMTVKLRTRPQFVNDYCTACGACIEVCPVERSDEFNYGFGKTKAVYLPHSLSFPQKYDIDTKNCSGPSCGKCIEVCDYDAINLQAPEKNEILEVHSVIVASGWKSFNPEAIEGLNYKLSPDIVSNTEFERLLSVSGPGKGKLIRPSDSKAPKSVAFVQCAGSRDRNHLSYCSAVCCSASLKHALNVVELIPDAKVSIFYIDLRVSGRNEDFLKRVEAEAKIQLIKGKVAKIGIEKDSGALSVHAENIHLGKKLTEKFDMVVLATGIIPNNDIPGLGKNEAGFYTVNQKEGIYTAACSKKPMDVSSSVKDATAAAIHAMKN